MSLQQITLAALLAAVVMTGFWFIAIALVKVNADQQLIDIARRRHENPERALDDVEAVNRTRREHYAVATCVLVLIWVFIAISWSGIALISLFT